MPKTTNAMEIIKVLNKSNCGKCHEKSCMAFAAAVTRGKRALKDCPSLEDDVIRQFEPESAHESLKELDGETILKQYEKQLLASDLAAAARRIGAPLQEDRLNLTVCGKLFSVDSECRFHSEIHTHIWLTVPALDYILNGEGLEPSGRWVPLRELERGQDWGRFFEHQCEKPMKKIADNYPDFFSDILHIFSGKQIEERFDSDISVVLHPLPKLSVLVCYWMPEEDLESDFHLFFDETADRNLSLQSIYSIMTGMLVMLQKIAQRHL
jgi:hypothetical protein